MLEPVVIGQDDQTELHVQALIQSGRRQLDIRIWRRGPTGFAPSRSALTLEVADVDALHEGIAELLEASHGGRQVARVVWDKDEGRRLRAETEPFGTRFVARFGFWQRVRDTWRQSDDGLIVAAEQLKPLQDVLSALRPRLLPPDHDSFPASLSADGHSGLHAASMQRWPTPGADWLTIDHERLAFHPRGVRITAAVEESDGAHRIAFSQWRREESLWLPEDIILLVGILELEALLCRLRDLADGKPEDEQATEEMGERDRMALRVSITKGEPTPTLLLEERLPPPDDYRFEPRLSLPAEYLPQFGRMLAQAGMLLLRRLSEDEREELQSRQGPEIAPAILNDAIGMPDDLSEPDDLTTESMRAAGSKHETRNDAERAGDVAPSPAGYPLSPESAGMNSTHGGSEPTRRLTALGEVQLGRFLVFLYLQEDGQRQLALLWDGYSLLLPVDQVQQTLSDLRDLYYDAIRGRRGQLLTAGAGTGIRISVHNQGSATALALEQEREGKLSRLAFPVGETPGFLDAAAAAMKKMGNYER